ncbi:MAG: hypothetical protein HY319_17470 [Armatimonadetes bacterium]|nr:hypothetical protein [Armatimonadota bacterium]
MQIPLTTVTTVQKAMALVAATNQQILFAAQQDEQPADKLQGHPGQVEFQDADAYIRLSSDAEGTPTRYESRALRALQTPEGIQLPAGTSTTYAREANGNETFENRFPTETGQVAVQRLKIDAQQGLLDFNEFLTVA